MASAERISVYSLADLKNTTDDIVPIYLNSLSFTQSHTLSDTRLVIGYSSFLLCAATFYWDYTLTFEATKSYTAISVLIYFLLNSLLTVWIFYVERGIIYIGTSPSGSTIEVSTKTRKHKPIYELTVRVWKKGSGRTGQPTETIVLKRPFREWFNEAGYLVVQPLQELLASNVPVVGAADPKRVRAEKDVKAERKRLEAAEGGEKSADAKWEALLRESSGEGAETSAVENVKAKKRGKNA